MTIKKILFWITFILTAICTIALIFFDKNPYPIIFLGIFILFLIYALWDMPPKHKTFSYMDMQRAFRASDISDLLKYTISSRPSRNRNYTRVKNIKALYSLFSWLFFSAGLGFLINGLRFGEIHIHIYIGIALIFIGIILRFLIKKRQI